jgi:hypothetical protein
MNQFLRILKIIGLFCVGLFFLQFLFRIGIVFVAFAAGGALVYFSMRKRHLKRY